MSILIGHASISETGGINGTKGDSTGKEVCTRTWYSKPWDYMALHPDATVREKHAAAVEAACANNNIGYGQSDRNTLNTCAKAVAYALPKIATKCNCDCSSLQNVAAVASGASGVTYGSNGWTTSTMKAALKAAGYKIIEDSTYLTSENYCVRGAIYVKASSHTVCGLTNGSKANQTLSKAGITSGGTASTSGNTSYSGKGIGTATAKTTMNIRSGAGTNYSSYGTVSKGTAVEVLEVLSSGWYKIVWPGASCGYAYTSNANSAYYTYVAKSTSASTSKKTATDSAKSKNSSLAGTYKTTANLNMRNGAGTNKSIMVTLPKGTSVKNYGYYTEVSGVKWLYVQVTYNNVTYTGFCSDKYLNK